MLSLKQQLIPLLIIALFTVTGNVTAGPKNTKGNNNLSPVETEYMLFMREEEKLARDVYLTLFDIWHLTIFKNIASSEQLHMNAMLTILEKYNLEDPATDDIGVFTDPDLQDLYNELITRGETSPLEALHVGAFIEETDIQDIQEAIDVTRQKDIIKVYENLLKGSRNHLRAFVGKIETDGIIYETQVLSNIEIDDVVNTPVERSSN